MYKLVGITGKAGAGKDALASELVMQFAYTKLSFAFYLKRMLSSLPFMEALNADDRVWKEKVHSFYKASPRMMMQTLGTEWARQMVNPEIWIKLAQYQIENKQMLLNKKAFVFSDLRFENEAQWIRSAGGVLVHIKRDNLQEVRQHVSENQVTHKPEDFWIENNGTLEQLRAWAKHIDDKADATANKSQ